MNQQSNRQDSLRHDAEMQLTRTLEREGASYSAEKLLHELQVHHIELKMQNEELRRSQVLLEESRDHYMDLYEFAPVGYLTLSREGQIVAVNLTGAALLGEDRKKLLKRRFASLVVPAEHDYWYQYFMRVLQHDEQQICELKLQRKDGAIFDAHLDGCRVIYSATPMLRITLTDITERKYLEQVLLDRNTDLDNARATAEKASLAKSVFLSSISHELRTPLNAILGFTQLLEAGSPPPTNIQKERLQQIIKAGWYLLDLINEILDLAVIESGKLSLSREAVSLAEIMRECQGMIEAQAQSRHIQVNFLPFDNTWHVIADRTRVKQVLINLLSNALKYNREQGTIEVECTCASRRIRIRIKDSGAGLSAEKLTQLFQPFNRLGQETGAEEGTGIGLVLSKQLVELMGGAISVKSTVGTGSEFTIELNQDLEPQLSAANTLPAETAPQKKSASQSTAAQQTLLYVEDNPDNLMLIRHIVEERLHMRMLSTHDGNTGVALARAHLPDIILMDINLHGISGIEAMNILHKDPATKHIPIIAISANAMPHDIQKGLDAGFFRYLTKPIKINEFMNVLDEALKFSAMELN